MRKEGGKEERNSGVVKESWRTENKSVARAIIVKDCHPAKIQRLRPGERGWGWFAFQEDEIRGETVHTKNKFN